MKASSSLTWSEDRIFHNEAMIHFVVFVTLQEIKKTNASKKRCLIVTVVSCLLLMSAILVSGIYFGMLTHKHYKVTY